MKNLIYVALMLVISISSCKKGDTGPAGKDGNASVKSYILTVKPADWTSFLGTYNAYPKLTAINDSVFNNGTVLLYYKNGTNSWANLPILGYNYGFSKNTTSGNYIWIYFSGATAPTTDVVFRAVVIPGSSVASYKNMTFTELKEVFDLKE